METDFVVKGALVFMIYRQCFEKRDVAVAGGRFFEVSPALCYPGAEVIDGRGRRMIPGLIDIHMRIESSVIYPAGFFYITLLYGVTTVVADAHEIANVSGITGIEWFMGQKTDQDISYAIPSSVSVTNERLEISGAKIGEKETKILVENNRVLCPGEVMNFKDLTSQDDTLIKRLVRMCRDDSQTGKISGKGNGPKSGMRTGGHCPRITGTDLCRFIYEGADADYTQQTPESALEKTDMGMFMEFQYRSLTREAVEAMNKFGLYENAALITDDIMPDQFLKGQLNRVLSHAARMGVPVEKAIHCVILTLTRRMHPDDRGTIAPGKLADFVLLDDLEDFQSRVVYKNGTCVYGKEQAAEADDGRTGSTIVPEAFYHPVKCSMTREEDFFLKAVRPCHRVRVDIMKIQAFGTATSRVIRESEVKDGILCWKETSLSLAVVFERYGKNGNISYGLVEGVLKRPGAIATTWSHDNHNLSVLGTCEKDMAVAQNRVVTLQDGYVAAEGGKVMVQALFPVGGIIYDRPVEELACDLAGMRRATKRLGYKNNNEIMSMSTPALPVSLQLKSTDYGLLDVRSQEQLPLIEDYMDQGSFVMKTVIKNGIIVTMNSRMDVYPDGHLIMEDDRVSEVGPMTGYDAYKDRQGMMVIDVGHAIVMSGMVNTHCHMGMIPLRGLGDDCRNRLRVFLLPMELRAMDRELVRLSSRFAVCELLLSGATTVTDMYCFEDAVAGVMDEMSIRRIVGETVMEDATCDAGTSRESIARGEELIRRYKNHPRIMGCISPHDTTTCSSSTLQKIHELDQEYGVPFTFYVAEMDYEVSYLREQFGCTPVEYSDRLGVLDPLTVYAHSIRVSQQDINLMGSVDSGVIRCTGSNTKAAKGVAPVSFMLDQGIAVGLGTDGLASSNALDLSTQMGLCANLHKNELKDRSAFLAKDIVFMATIWGANALGLGEVTGSLEPGKAADVTVVETDSFNMFPAYDLCAVLMYSARADNVRDVHMVGSCLVRDRRPVPCNMGEIWEELRQKMNRTSFGEIIHYRKQAPRLQY